MTFCCLMQVSQQPRDFQSLIVFPLLLEGMVLVPISALCRLSGRQYDVNDHHYYCDGLCCYQMLSYFSHNDMEIACK